ncbi:metallo-beta-lactamase family protein [Arthrobacter silviterrae]|uniref:MBL fold metallo-hydrolase n=1 Tax=Arthrobacter silviterrae TaxID=2026658 RepID=A0ABX0DEP0_9MICC|nr:MULTISPECIES: MBL fold metallo-hydrolase [Arthrobacter]MCU6482100.1 MBL fold metallo-hydrolase [Arthrobacter sp. A2-55]MDQ0275975.1 metallo-beta-lactamase family protein [Arthrobacter silviterrae]NGN84225.1 MBL fold metallo-hydrolase [Arthrobacter silviterrae]
MAANPFPSLRFLGATGTVTGSKYLIDTGRRRVLVDCGLFQGYKMFRERNRAPLPVRASSIDAVVITHAHLDHTGYLPALVRDGYDGPIHATGGTAELSGLVLPDSGHLLEEEARYAAHRGSSVHHPPMPLYTAADAVKALKSFKVQEFDTPFELADGIEATLVPAGHILGAAQVHLRIGGLGLHFTGDLGRSDDPLMKPPRPLESVDVLVTESTYGNRTHPDTDPAEELGQLVTRVAKRGGVVLIAAFAVGRAETVLLALSRLLAHGGIPSVPVFLNSPMAIDASHIYQQHRDEHRLNPRDFASMYKLATMTRTADESKLLNLRGGPMIVISASGMLTGGRILHHISAYGGDPKNAIVLAGYQAPGTRGAALAGGQRTLRIYGEDVTVRAEVAALDGFSAHADSDALVRWMQSAPKPPRMTYITHGEPDSADALRLRIKHELGWHARVPEHLETISLRNPK